MTKFTDNPDVQAMVVRMTKGKLPPGVKRATEQVDKPAVLAAAKPARQAIQGYLGMDPSYSVMDPQAEKLASAYRTGEATSVLGDLAGALSPFAYASALSKVGQVPGIAELIAYHGSPHKFKKFDASKIGTGEGAQAFGHGLYFAESPSVADNYRSALSSARTKFDGKPLHALTMLERDAADYATTYGGKQQALDVLNSKLNAASKFDDLDYLAKVRDKLQNANVDIDKGSLYKVDIPDNKIAQMLDWDKPLSQQPKAVQEAINKSEYALRDMAMDLYGKKDPLGSEIARAALKPQEFAEHMKELGVPGIRYLDQGSRGTGKGTSNFVVFPGEEESIKMLEINGTPEMAKGGLVHMQDGGDPAARFMGKTKPQGIMQAKGFGEGPGMRPLQEAADVARGLLGAEAIISGGEGYRTGQALANMPAVGLAAVPGKVASALPEVVTGLGALGAAGVIKPKGGNWISGVFSAEKMLEPLKKPLFPGRLPFGADAQAIANALGETPEQVLATADPTPLALNKWIDTKLTKYVKNEMATPEDPVRALAERGVLHYQPQNAPVPQGFELSSKFLRENREKGGFPTEGAGRSNLARDWEALMDISIQPERAKEFSPTKSEIERDPWLEKVLPESMVYLSNMGLIERSGFNHLVDELNNALNPNSGLPASLRLTPKQLEKVTVPQAVERVAKINEWRAAQKAEADALRARNPGTFEHKTYETVPGTAKPNEKGMRWVELKLPEVTSPDQLTNPEAISKYNQYLSVAPDNPEVQKAALSRAAKIQNEPVLQDALKYEGEVMGHCVGGYCPDVIEGRSRIYSLRDKKGEPHVTIEVTPRREDTDQLLTANQLPFEIRADYERRNVLDPLMRFDPKTFLPELGQFEDEIVQIKGKGNKAPKEEYLPFVQDFVRSGNWSKVGDLQNTGLMTLRPEYNKDLVDAITKSGGTAPSYVTKEELANLVKTYLPDENYARGGKVRISNNPDTMRLELLRKKHA